MGNPFASVRDVVSASEGHQRTNICRFSCKKLSIKTATIYEELPNEVAEVFTTQTIFSDQTWQLYFDNASQTSSKVNPISGVGAILVFPQGYMIP